MAPLSAVGRSIKFDIAAVLSEQGLALRTDGAQEEVDLVLVAVGSNDLAQHSMSADVIGRLFELQRNYAARGLAVRLVSLGGVGPGEEGKWAELEADRACVNARLLQEDCVLDFDSLIAGLGPEMWADAWHLSREGASAYGLQLAAALAPQLPLRPSEPVGRRAGDLLQVSGSLEAAGLYVLQGVNHGRPVFRRLGAAPALLFFWDSRDGPDWQGWWLGPEIGWDHPGWARHEDCSALRPPTSGWHVPARGAVADEQLRVVTAEEPEQQLRVSGCAAVAGRYAACGANHGRPMYGKEGAVVFFWDGRDGPGWAGWWFGPEIGWAHPGWARHEDCAAQEPPGTGWRVPADGPVDVSLQLLFGQGSG